MAASGGSNRDRGSAREDTSDFMTLSVPEDELDEFQYPSRPRTSKAEKSHHKKHAKDRSPRKREKTVSQDKQTAPHPEKVQRSVEEHMDATPEVMQETQEEQGELSPASLSDLYRSLNMNLEKMSKHGGKYQYQLSTIHVRGIDQLGERDMLNFFEDLHPLKTEWVSDTSCNVVFPDEIAAAFALKAVSQPLRILTRPRDLDSAEHNFIPEEQARPAVEFDPDTEEEVYVSDLVAFPLPVPKGSWRVARIVPNRAKQLIFRFARASDKMPENASQAGSQYYSNVVPQKSTRRASPNRPVSARAPVVLIADLKKRDYSPIRTQLTGNGHVKSRSTLSSSDERVSSHHARTPYERPSTHRVADRPLPVRPEMHPGDLRYLLQHREEALPISSDDLRHRIGQGAHRTQARSSVHSRLGRGGLDLRNRINLVRRMGPV